MQSMQMNKKYLSVIIFTAVFVLAIIVCIVVANIKIDITADSDTTTSKPHKKDPSAVETEIIEAGGTTAIVPANTNSPATPGTNNVLDGIMDDIYDKNKPVIINPAYGNNVNTGADGYDVDGQAVTTVYDTVESTKNGETTKPEPETTTAPAVTTATQKMTTEKQIEKPADSSEETTGVS